MQRNVNVNGIWKTINITYDEREDILKDLLRRNREELIRCFHESKEIIDNISMTNLNGILTQKDIIKMLYEKQATSSYTIFQEFLDKKANETREQKKELPPEKEKEIEEVVKENLQEKDKLFGKSIFSTVLKDE
jgi:hypothetical protein